MVAATPTRMGQPTTIGVQSILFSLQYSTGWRHESKPKRGTCVYANAAAIFLLADGAASARPTELIQKYFTSSVNASDNDTHDGPYTPAESSVGILMYCTASLAIILDITGIVCLLIFRKTKIVKNSQASLLIFIYTVYTALALWWREIYVLKMYWI